MKVSRPSKADLSKGNPMTRPPNLVRLLALSVIMLAPSAMANPMELKARDAFFFPGYTLTEEQKNSLIPLIEKRNEANKNHDEFMGVKMSAFGFEASKESEAAQKLNHPEDKEVRKILTREQAKNLQQSLEKNREKLEETDRTFPPLEGNFFGIEQSLTPRENGSYQLDVLLSAVVPSPDYKIVVDNQSVREQKLSLTITILKPHPYALLDRAPGQHKISHLLTFQSDLPETFEMHFREKNALGKETDYSGVVGGNLLQP